MTHIYRTYNSHSSPGEKPIHTVQTATIKLWHIKTISKARSVPRRAMIIVFNNFEKNDV